MKTIPTFIALAAALAIFLSGFAIGAPMNKKTKPYPSKICLVTDNKLGSMGKPYRIVHEGQEIKFCCKPCLKKFNADPAKYLAKLKR